MMERRGIVFDDIEKDIFTEVYKLTDKFRNF